MRARATILFDEAHSNAWTIRPEIAAEINPSHPADSSYARAAEILRAHDFEVSHDAALADAAVLVIAHPSEPKWERVVPGGSPVFSAEEIDAIEAFVTGGGGLIVLAEEEQEKYGTNLAELVQRFGIAIDNAVVHDYEHNHQAPSWVLADLSAERTAVDLLARVGDVCFYRGGTLTPGAGARVLARTSPTASTPAAPLLAVTEHGAGRVVVAADSDLFGDDCIDDLGHADLWRNLVFWVAGPRLAGGTLEAPSDVAADPAWLTLKHHTDALRELQAPDGAAGPEAAAHVDAMAGAIEALAPRFPHDADYLAAVVSDLRGWAAAGFGKPDFAASLDVFRPDLSRQDGIEHLVVFPMYLQNAGSRDTHF